MLLKIIILNLCHNEFLSYQYDYCLKWFLTFQIFLISSCYQWFYIFCSSFPPVLNLLRRPRPLLQRKVDWTFWLPSFLTSLFHQCHFPEFFKWNKKVHGIIECTKKIIIEQKSYHLNFHSWNNVCEWVDQNSVNRIEIIEAKG